mgnify:CR=1 FL=1
MPVMKQSAGKIWENRVWNIAAPLRARKAAFTVLTVLLAYLASLFGFGSLIGTLYPLFGYASALFLVLMLLHAVLLFRRKTP